MAYTTTNEYKFWKLLRDKLRKDMLLSRIESVVSVGVPDVYYATRDSAVSGWIELKVVHGKQVRFGKEQVAWIKQHHAAGVTVHILAVKAGPQSGPNAKTIYHWLGSSIDGVKTRGIEEPAENEWRSPFDWQDVRGKLSQG
tara:strand:- start:5448 stop:5870 length:423 start_codon:yes stop_codon:yes gene_type:complete